MRLKNIFIIIFCISLFTPTVLAGKKRIFTEKFENVEEGTLPKGWIIQQGVSFDMVSVQQHFADQGKKSLKLREIPDGISVLVDSEDFKTYITDDFEFSFFFRIIGDVSGRAKFVLLDEKTNKAIGINCRLNDDWRYSTKMSLWNEIPNLPTPISGELYEVHVLLDTKNERMNIEINGIESGWIDVGKSWKYISKISFSSNDNHPSEFWIDEITIREAQIKKQK